MLAVDVGNTNTVLGLYRDERLAHSWRLPSRRDATTDELAIVLRGLCAHGGVAFDAIAAVAVASVVPPLTGVWQALARSALAAEPLMVDWRSDTGLELRVDHPAELGADRIVNAVAAWRRYGAPVVIVDFGTATTVDAVGAGGVYLGGAIAPGIGIAADALFRSAALLHRVELASPPSALGRNTEHQMQAGIVIGGAGQVDALVERIRLELSGPARVVATGGLAGLIAGSSRTIDTVDDMLTLEGLRLVHERRKPAAGRDLAKG